MKHKMIPVGYMAKRIMDTPEEYEHLGIVEIYSVSSCMCHDFADYTDFWRHNGYWIFDSPQIIREIAQEHSIELAGTKLFYYEAYHLAFHENNEWKPFEPEASFTTNIEKPGSKTLQGYDIVAFSQGYNPECSPLSCNYLANTIAVNEHCLIASFDDACQILESGKFLNAEPGPYRIMAVYSVE